MSDSYGVIVVGVGAMGSSACLHLARRGVRVLGLEQFDIPHGRGSSHGHSRMIRLCYYEHPDYVPLLGRAYELWRDLETASGQSLLHVTGGLYMGRTDGAFVEDSRRAAVEHGLPHEILTHADLAVRYPQFRLPGDHAALYEPAAGLLIPEAVVAAQAEQALRHGAHLHGHEPVIEWFADGRGVRVRTACAEYEAGHLVLTSGAWAGRVVQGLGVPLVVTRQVMGWVWPRRPEWFERGRLPVWAIEAQDASIYYGFPMMPQSPGFKLAHHFQGAPTDPDRTDWDVRPEDERDFRPALKRYVPEADGRLLAMRVCMYTNTPDSHFIIDRHPAHERVTVACGFSGHGFKFASVVGEALADLAMQGMTRLPIGFLGLKRFARGA